MGCNCRKAGKVSTSYVYIAPDGTTKTYSTEVEAKAAKIRAGNVGTVSTA